MAAQMADLKDAVATMQNEVSRRAAQSAPSDSDSQSTQRGPSPPSRSSPASPLERYRRALMGEDDAVHAVGAEVDEGVRAIAHPPCGQLPRS